MVTRRDMRETKARRGKERDERREEGGNYTRELPKETLLGRAYYCKRGVA